LEFRFILHVFLSLGKKNFGKSEKRNSRYMLVVCTASWLIAFWIVMSGIAFGDPPLTHLSGRLAFIGTHRANSMPLIAFVPSKMLGSASTFSHATGRVLKKISHSFAQKRSLCSRV
jgi:hypothetical protein